jgi:hypothetical protein
MDMGMGLGLWLGCVDATVGVGALTVGAWLYLNCL